MLFRYWSLLAAEPEREGGWSDLKPCLLEVQSSKEVEVGQAIDCFRIDRMGGC